MGNRKLPFGYKMVMGEIVVHPQEVQAVQGIYAHYLAGASFNDITDHLKEKGPPYDANKPWNKNTKWAPYLRERYFDVLEKCTYISAVCEVGAPDAQLQAYKKIIDLADVVLAVYDRDTPPAGSAEDRALA